ncbi:MAG: ankyrin repeat domain-containing protein [Gammaproteobacteria bacterium]
MENAFSKHPTRAKGFTPLMVNTGNASVEKILLKRGAKVDLATGRGVTALMRAAKYGSGKSIRILLKAGANRCKTDKAGKTAFDYSKDRTAALTPLNAATLRRLRCATEKQG